MCCLTRTIWLVLLLLVSLLGPGSPVLGNEDASPSPAPAGTATPVTFAGETLFSIHRGLGSFTADERASAVSRRLGSLLYNPEVRADSIRVLDEGGTSNIQAGGITIMTVSDEDARAADRVRKEMAGEYALKIGTTLATARYYASKQAVLNGVILSLLATLAFLLILLFCRRFFPWLYAWVEARRGTGLLPVRLRALEAVFANHLVDLTIKLVRSLRVMLVIVFGYLYISLVFSCFYWTRGYAGTLLNYVIAPLRDVGRAFVAFLPNVFFIAIVALITSYAIKLIHVIFTAIEKQTIRFPGFHKEWAEPTYQIVRFLVIALATVVIFPYMPGYNSPAFQGISVFLGVLLSLGSTSAVANIIGGIVITYMMPFKIGDRVKIADTVGDVVEKTLLVTRIRTIKNENITIPNSMVLGSHIVNYSSSSQDRGLILHTSVTIGYDAPWRQVHELLIAAARATQNILAEPAPFVLQTSLDDFYVSYQLNAYTDQPNRMAVIYSDLHQHIQDRFNEAGVEIMSPHYATLRDGNQTTIPADYLPKTYDAPAFRVKPVVPPDPEGTSR